MLNEYEKELSEYIEEYILPLKFKPNFYNISMRYQTENFRLILCSGTTKFAWCEINTKHSHRTDMTVEKLHFTNTFINNEFDANFFRFLPSFGAYKSINYVYINCAE